jgi:hypothetical protein
MSRTIRTTVAAVTAVAALAAVGTAAAAPKGVEDSVGLGLTINLKMEAKKPLPPGNTKSRVFRFTNIRANASVVGAASGVGASTLQPLGRAR